MQQQKSKDDIGRKIDDTQFSRSFFKALPHPNTHQTNPFGRPDIWKSPEAYKYAFPDAYNREPEITYTTSCCNSSTSTSIGGRKMAHDPTETATYLNADLRLVRPRERAKTTYIMGLRETENEDWVPRF